MYRVVLPFGKRIRTVLEDIILETLDGSLQRKKDASVLLLKGQTYLFPCCELNTTKAFAHQLRGSLSPKSSIGRVDVMVRVIVDQCGLYDTIELSQEADEETREVWLEVSPRSFNIRVRPGVCLTQLMLFQSTSTPVPQAVNGTSGTKRAALILTGNRTVQLISDQEVLFHRDNTALKPKFHLQSLVLSLNVVSLRFVLFWW